MSHSEFSLFSLTSGLVLVLESSLGLGRSLGTWFSVYTGTWVTSVSLHFSLHTPNDKKLSTSVLLVQLLLLYLNKIASCHPDPGFFLSLSTGAVHLLSRDLCPPGGEGTECACLFSKRALILIREWLTERRNQLCGSLGCHPGG